MCSESNRTALNRGSPVYNVWEFISSLCAGGLRSGRKYPSSNLCNYEIGPETSAAFAVGPPLLQEKGVCVQVCAEPEVTSAAWGIHSFKLGMRQVCASHISRWSFGSSWSSGMLGYASKVCVVYIYVEAILFILISRRYARGDAPRVCDV